MDTNVIISDDIEDMGVPFHDVDQKTTGHKAFRAQELRARTTHPNSQRVSSQAQSQEVFQNQLIPGELQGREKSVQGAFGYL